MTISERISNASSSIACGRVGWIILSYVALAIMLAVGIWVAAGGPDMTEVLLAVATVLP